MEYSDVLRRRRRVLNRAGYVESYAEKMFPLSRLDIALVTAGTPFFCDEDGFTGPMISAYVQYTESHAGIPQTECDGPAFTWHRRTADDLTSEFDGRLPTSTECARLDRVVARQTVAHTAEILSDLMSVPITPALAAMWLAHVQLIRCIEASGGKSLSSDAGVHRAVATLRVAQAEFGRPADHRADVVLSPAQRAQRATRTASPVFVRRDVDGRRNKTMSVGIPHSSRPESRALDTGEKRQPCANVK